MTQLVIEMVGLQREGKQLSSEHLLLEALTQKVREFDQSVWSDLHGIVNECPTRGMSFRTPGFSLLTYTMAGRVMLTFEDPISSVTTLTADGEGAGRMGLQGIDSTFTHAINLLDTAMTLFQDGKIKLEPDTKIGIA
jgi:hypothetical protein